MMLVITVPDIVAGLPCQISASLAGITGINQGGQAKERPQDPPVPGDKVSKGGEGQDALKSHNDPFECIVDSRKCKANIEVFNAFIGQPKKHDPSHIKLKETGWAMAKRVFHLPEAERWPTKEANAFMNKHITLVPQQRKDLESDLTQESFLKDFEKSPSYKASFEFKTKMFASMKSQRTSLVPLFRLTDSVTQVKQHVDETLDISWAVVIPESNPEAGYTGSGEKDVPTIFKPLLAPPQVPLRHEED